MGQTDKDTQINEFEFESTDEPTNELKDELKYELKDKNNKWNDPIFGKIKLDLDLDQFFVKTPEPTNFNEQVVQVYNKLSKYSGAAIMSMYYIHNTNSFYNLDYTSQISQLATPFLTGYLFGKIITPVAVFMAFLKNVM